MAINFEISYDDEEYNIINKNKIQIINEYYNFELNNVELNKFWRILREGKNSNFLINYKIEKNFIMNNFYDPENYLGKNEIFEKTVYEDFNEIYSKVADCFLNLNSYPYLKNTIFEDFKNKISIYKENEYKQIYFFILFLSKRKLINEKVKEFYRKKFTSNFQNLSGMNSKGNTIRNIIGEENPIERDAKNVLNSLNLEMIKTNSFKDFVFNLSKWYSLAEVILFNLGILNEYYGFTLEFEEEKFSLTNNIGFSLETFAKKNILKLISYCLKKLTFNVNFKEFNYKRVLIILASSLTSGISFPDFIFKNFMIKDIKQFALAGGIFMNFFIGKMADSIENFSDSLDFARIMEILKKLNEKLMKIEKKLNKLLMRSLKLKLFEFVGIGENKADREKHSYKKKVLSQIIIKYLQGIENIDEEEERNLMNESILLKSDFDKSIQNKEKIDENWVLLAMRK